MNKLEELINGLCPDGVEYKKLADVCNFNRGTSLVSKNAKSGDIPVISGGQKPAFYHNEANRTGTTITVAGSGAYAGYVSIWYEPIFVCDAFSVEPKNADELDIKYLYHYLTNNQKKIYNKKTGAGIPHVHGKDIAKFSIPLPPLSIQSEIVHILDSFTLLTAELTARQKQYAFYRDYLLDFSAEDVTKKIPDIDCSNIKYVKLGDISKIVRGASPRPIKNFITTSSTGINWIKIGDVNVNSKYITKTKEKITQEGATKSRYVRKGDFILSNSMSFGRPYILEIDGCIHDGWLSISEFEKYVTADYLYYYLISNKLQKEMKQRASFGGAVQNLNADIVRDLEIAVPPLSVQENIVKILDRFDKLNNDMSEGLPAEIEARKKQYEYYRDTLLSFDDKACSQIVKVERERELTRIKAIKWLKLGEIASIIRGGNFQKKDFVEQGKPCIHYGQIYTRLGTTTSKSITYLNDDVYSKSKKAMPNDIVMAVTSENIEDVCKSTVWLGNEDLAVSGHTAIIHPSINSKYLAYYFQTTMFFKQKRKLAHGTKVIEVTPDKLNDIIIPVPPLEEQERIVSILDRFDKLCNDISEGLPAEIEARQKQYEYYRDKLLMFKKVEANEK